MKSSGSRFNPDEHRLFWFLAELTYKCPLQCLYCSNPLNLAEKASKELSTEEWKSTLKQARQLGAVQLGFSGGEPLLRKDLEELVGYARKLGFYTNLLTSGMTATEKKITQLKEAGLDHIQLSVESVTSENDGLIEGTPSLEKKRQVAHWIKESGIPMVLNVVLHRHNIDTLDEIIRFAESVNAPFLELANTQYHGWAAKNRSYLLPTREQIHLAKEKVHRHQARLEGKMKIYHVVADYFSDRPKPCCSGWGKIMMMVNPVGEILPCHSAGQLPGPPPPNVREMDIETAWKSSEIFNRFRGEDWMKPLCKSCPERKTDFAGCRCQAFQLTGDPTETDPVCQLSNHRSLIEDHLNETPGSEPLYRNLRNSKRLTEQTD